MRQLTSVTDRQMDTDNVA